MKALVVEGFDRAAPQGVGGVKVAGNYAADILPNTLNKKKGYPISLYLDSKTQSYIEEFSTSNFFGIKDDGKTYVTPESAAVLPSITNKSLMALATAAGLKVERRAVPVDELDDFTEVDIKRCLPCILRVHVAAGFNSSFPTIARGLRAVFG